MESKETELQEFVFDLRGVVSFEAPDEETARERLGDEIRRHDLLTGSEKDFKLLGTDGVEDDEVKKTVLLNQEKVDKLREKDLDLQEVMEDTVDELYKIK